MSVLALLLATTGFQQDVARTEQPLELNAYVTHVDPIPAGCMRRFMRLKIPELSLVATVEVDAQGRVESAALESHSSQAELDACILQWMQTTQFKEDGPKRGTYVAKLTNARLSPPLPEYEQPAAGGSIEIRNWSRLALCKVAGLHGPSHKSACRASVILVDGRRTSFLASENSVVPGSHRLTLSCDVHDYSTTGSLTATGSGQTHVFDFESDGVYELRPRWEDDTCVVDVVNVETGQVLQGRPSS